MSGLSFRLQLLGKEPVQQVGVVQQSRLGKEVGGRLAARGAVGVEPHEAGAAVARGVDRLGLQHLLDAMLARLAAPDLVQNGEGQGLVVGDGERLGGAKGNLPGFQGIQHRRGQGGECEAAIDMGLGDAEGPGDGRHVRAALAHPPEGADFVGGVQVLAGGVLDRRPRAGGGFIRGQPDRNKGEVRARIGKCRVTLKRQLDRAPAAATRDHANLSGFVAETRDRLDQPDHGDAVGQQGDTLGVGLLPGVHVGQVEVGKRDALEGRGFGGEGFAGEGGHVGHDGFLWVQR